MAGVAHSSASAAVGPVGNGFTVTTGDLSFILKQIKIAERHAFTRDAAHPCSTLLNQPGDGIPDAEQVPDIITSYGLRTVDGSCNNLKTGDENFAAADQPFLRLTTPVFNAAEDSSVLFGPSGGPTSYTQKLAGNIVVDSQPRVISNLIVDQTAANPAAIAAAAFPVRSQSAPGLHPCTTDPDPTATPPVVGVPAGCVPSNESLFIPNVTTDVGLSPPYNSLFTFFGQFFDHGVDQTVKSGGTVFVPLKADDPLRLVGPDGIAGTNCGTPTAAHCDEVPASQAFMVLTRAQNQPGPDGQLGTADDIQNANNTDTPWVDQSQTYTSHASHQAFLRAYAAGTGTATNPLGATNPAAVSTGKLLGGDVAGVVYPTAPDGTEGIGTWFAVKKQAHDLLGLQLVDTDVTNIPMLATDPYGKFIPGSARGLPQYVTASGLVEGDLANPVPVPANALHFDTPFLTDIAHNADPSERDTNNDGIPDTFPTPDTDTTPSAGVAAQPAGTNDDEMLNAHFACGDGRCNENIALSTIHQVFHSEHDRLVDYIKNALETDTSPAGIAALAQWQAIGVSGYNYGERLFQAARFVTEMEYQHLVFEEFARKIQPAVRPFHVYSPDVNPAVEAEFAHAVYRFGHSMLDDDVARTNSTTNPDGSVTKSDNSIPLLTAFLNPPEFFNGGTAGTLGARAAAGSVIMGSSDQVGNELDEFVVKTLRSNLLGLPLDLPTLNMTRARDAGVPPLNDVRRQIFAQTNDGQLTPYTSWSDFGQHLKHPESLINFVAAYGQHPSITSQTTLAGKRAAAKAIVDPGPTDTTLIPEDAAQFMFSTDGTSATCPSACNWTSTAGVTNTGLDSVDLWVGGLAEVTNLFGGLLGSTFNYVFETQLEKLQDGDRFYYLARTPGINFRTQLEGNSFAELIQRNTDNTNTLKADAFATADCKFQLGNITSPYSGGTTLSQSASPPLTPLSGAGTVNDDPTTTDCDENQLLLKQPNGTVQYRQFNKINPSGINGQSVYQGTDGNDRVFGGNDNDTFWGGKGNDVIEGNGGDDVALGGEGNDIITDLSGADVLKGGPGNDAIDGGIGNDILLGGDGSDFINGGANDNETFAGPGNDFVIAGQGADAVFGDGGDDWIQGGTGQDLLQGDHGAPFFDDPGEIAPGNDIMIGQPGENDYDAEGGDDVMAQNAAVDRNAGSGGFDWAIHQYNTIPADDDMMINNNLGGLPIQIIVNRDRWQETEADSGSGFNDVIKGTDGVLATPRLITGGGFQGCDAIDQAGLDRITGLAPLLPPVTAWLGTATAVAALSVSGRCPLSGAVWGEGDILMGGGGSDTITGRAGDEIIDGDKELRVAISVRTNPASPATEIGRTDLMENAATSGNFGAGTTGMTLQQAVFAGLVNPGNLVGVREIITPATPAPDCGTAAPKNCDTAEYSGPRASYTIAARPAVGASLPFIQVTDNRAVRPDGVDTLRNIEQLSFCPTPGAVRGTCAVARTLFPLTAVVSVSPTSAAFGNQAVNTSITRAITVRNTGFANLVVSGVSVGGTDASSFTAASGCTAPVAPTATCTVSVTFAPTTLGAKSATVSIASNDLASPKVVAVSGTSVPTFVTATPNPLVFTNQAVGTTSATRTITVTNTGTAAVTVSASFGGADASQFPNTPATTCVTGRTLGAGATCAINVRFAPTGTSGTRTATVTVVSPSGGTTVVTLTGTATTPPTIGALANVNFGAGRIAPPTSASRTLLVTNTGVDPLVISGLAITGAASAPFSATLGTCSTPVAGGGGTCQLNVSFVPTVALITSTGVLTITSNASNNPRAVTLTARS